jgi:hypothetical protein
VSDPILNLRWLGAEADPYWLDVRENEGPPVSVRVFNGAYRYVRLELFNADLDPPGPLPDSPTSPPLPVSMDIDDPSLKDLVGWGAEFPLTNLWGLDQYISARDGPLGFGVFPEFGAGKKDVPLDGYGWVKRYRLEVVGYSTLDDFGLEAPFRYHQPYQTGVLVDLTKWEALTLATLLTQVVEPVLGTLLGRSKSWGPLLALVGLAVWQVLRANNMEWNSPAAVGQAVVTVITKALDVTNNDPLYRLVREEFLSRAPGGLAGAFIGRLGKMASGIGVVFDVATVAGVAMFYVSVGQVRTRHDLIISTSANETLVRVTPPALSREVTEQFGVNLLLTWTTPPSIHMPLPKTTTVDTATQILLARGSKVGTEIVLSDWAEAGGDASAGLPLEIKLKPHQGAEGLVHAEAWDPRLGDSGVAVTFDRTLFPLYVGDHVGSGQLEIFVANWDLPNRFDTPGLTRSVPLEVRPAKPTVSTLPRLEVNVGERDHHRVSVSLTSTARAGEPHFDSTTAFIGGVQIADDGSWLRARELEVFAPNRWSGEQELRALPFTVLLEHDGVDDQARVRFFEPESDELYTDRKERFASLGDYILGRRSGTATVSVIVEIADPQHFQAPAQPTSFTVDVLPTPLELEVSPAEDPLDDGTLVLEDRFVDGRLLGSFRVQVRARGAPIFDSDVPAQLRGTVQPNRLLVEDVFVEDEAGDLQALPFRIQAIIGDTSVVEFQVPESTPAGAEEQFHYWGTLEDLVSATGSGTTGLEVSLLEPDVPLADDQVYYDMPDSVTLPVKVPAPLVAHLWFWEDGYFTGSEIMDLSGSYAPNSQPRMDDLIYAHGRISGRVDHHNPDSASEEITLRVDPPGSGRQCVDLLDADAVDEDGVWEQEVEGLRKGDNLIRLTAWKPINEIVHGGPSIVECILPGVQPGDLEVLVQHVGPSEVFEGNPDGGPVLPSTEPFEDRIVVRRSLADVEVRYSRAIWARLIDDAVPIAGGLHYPDPFEEANATRHLLTDQYGLAYNLRTLHTGLLPNELSLGAPVAHQIKVLAWNEYVDDETFDWVSPSVTLFAPDPHLEVRDIAPDGPYRDESHVGNSTTTVDATIRVGIALGMEVRDGNGTELGSITYPNPFSPPPPPDEELRLPPAGALAIGENDFEVTAHNEFALRRIEIQIHRRDHIFETIAGRTKIQSDDSDIDVKVQVREGGNLNEMMTATDPVFPVWERTFAGEAPEWSLGWSRLRYRLVTLDSDGVPHAHSGRTRITLEGDITGPDYERYDPVLLIPDGWIDDGNPNNSPAPFVAPVGSAYYFRVVLNPVSGGRVVTWVIMPPGGFPAQGI